MVTPRRGWGAKGFIGRRVANSRWLLVRLFVVLVLTFAAYSTKIPVFYAFQGEPLSLSVEQINRHQLPSEAQVDRTYVRVHGTPAFDPRRPNSHGSGVAASSRGAVDYYYFGLKETDGNLLIQTVQESPPAGAGEMVWEGKLTNVQNVIYQGTTKAGLRNAGLPQDESVPVVQTNELPEGYRQHMPIYLAIFGAWGLSIFWLLWKRNQPIMKRRRSSPASLEGKPRTRNEGGF